MKTIYLIRHGEVHTEWRHRYNGWNNIGLSSEGKKQIQRIADDLGDIPMLYSSDLRRCSDFVGLFSAEKVLVTKELREKSWGKHEGMSFEEIEKSGIHYRDFTSYIASLDGETPEEFKQRITAFWRSIRDTLPDRTAILSHGGVVHQILACEAGITLEESYMRTHVEYGSITPLSIE